MPNSDLTPLDDPGQRTGEGSKSILPHLQRQQQTQLKMPLKKQKEDGSDAPDSVPAHD